METVVVTRDVDGFVAGIGQYGAAASGWGNDDWKATVDLTLDPGEQLRQVASEVRARDRRHAVVTSDLDDVARIDPMLQLIYV